MLGYINSMRRRPDGASQLSGVVGKMKLSEMKIGVPSKIVQVGGSGALRRRLLDMGLTPRTRVIIRKVAPMGDPIELTVRGYELTLRLDDADKIDVQPLAEGESVAKAAVRPVGGKV